MPQKPLRSTATVDYRWKSVHDGLGSAGVREVRISAHLAG